MKNSFILTKITKLPWFKIFVIIALLTLISITQKLLKQVEHSQKLILSAESYAISANANTKQAQGYILDVKKMIKEICY